MTSNKLHEKRLAAQMPSELLPFEGADHFTIGAALTAPDGALTKAALRLV